MHIRTTRSYDSIILILILPNDLWLNIDLNNLGTVYVHIPKTKRTKHDPCAVKCVFGCYGVGQKDYRCFDSLDLCMYIPPWIMSSMKLNSTINTILVVRGEYY